MEFVQALDGEFSPPLSERVDIAEYCAKMAALGTILLAWEGDFLLGLIGFYCNDQDSGTSYVSYIGVDARARGRGLGLELVRRAIERARSCGMTSMVVSTWENNETALRMYRRAGFVPTGEQSYGSDGAPRVHLRRDIGEPQHA